MNRTPDVVVLPNAHELADAAARRFIDAAHAAIAHGWANCDHAMPVRGWAGGSDLSGASSGIGAPPGVEAIEVDAIE